MIAVIDSGVANLASVMAALRRLNAEAVVTGDAATIRAASHVILPGVGAASAAMAKLRERNLVEVVRDLKQPVLGICLGMQLLFTSSEEGQAANAPLPCLDIIPGKVRRMVGSPGTPVPHMGWNGIKPLRPHAVLRDIAEESFVYFVHSYAAPIGDMTLASTDYGEAFTAVAAHRNFFGCQFHPERSGAVGSAILHNFLRL